MVIEIWERANREILPYALELAADPAIILLLFPPVLQMINCFT